LGVEESIGIIFYPKKLRDHGQIQYGVQDGRRVIKSIPDGKAWHRTSVFRVQESL
jgi:hypothetical protein